MRFGQVLNTFQSWHEAYMTLAIVLFAHYVLHLEATINITFLQLDLTSL